MGPHEVADWLLDTLGEDYRDDINECNVSMLPDS